MYPAYSGRVVMASTFFYSYKLVIVVWASRLTPYKIRSLCFWLLYGKLELLELNKKKTEAVARILRAKATQKRSKRTATNIKKYNQYNEIPLWKFNAMDSWKLLKLAKKRTKVVIKELSDSLLYIFLAIIFLRSQEKGGTKYQVWEQTIYLYICGFSVFFCCCFVVELSLVRTTLA